MSRLNHHYHENYKRTTISYRYTSYNEFTQYMYVKPNIGQKVSGQKVSGHKVSKRDSMCQKSPVKKFSAIHIINHECAKIWAFSKIVLGTL